MSDLLEPWSTWATRVGVRPSMTGIGEAAGLPTSTISRLIKGRTTEATIRAVASALRVTPRQILEAATGSSLGPWVPPLGSHLLRDDEREALGLLIQRLAESREGGSSASTGEPIKKTPSGPSGPTPDASGTVHEFMAPAAGAERHRDRAGRGEGLPNAARPKSGHDPALKPLLDAMDAAGEHPDADGPEGGA